MQQPDILTCPRLEQRLAMEDLNRCLGNIAIAFHLDHDELSELAGGRVEASILELQPSEDVA